MRKTIYQLEKRGLPFHDLIRGIVMIESFSLFWFELDIKTQLKSHSTVSFQGNWVITFDIKFWWSLLLQMSFAVSLFYGRKDITMEIRISK